MTASKTHIRKTFVTSGVKRSSFMFLSVAILAGALGACTQNNRSQSPFEQRSQLKEEPENVSEENLTQASVSKYKSDKEKRTLSDQYNDLSKPYVYQNPSRSRPIASSRLVKLQNDNKKLEKLLFNRPVESFDVCENFNPESHTAGISIGRLEAVGRRLQASGDVEKAILCYENASIFAHGDASKYLAKIYETGHGDVISKDLPRAFLHYIMRYRFHKDQADKAKVDLIKPMLSPADLNWVEQQKQQRLQFMTKWISRHNEGTPGFIERAKNLENTNTE